jgi:hypothetical protein
MSQHSFFWSLLLVFCSSQRNLFPTPQEEDKNADQLDSDVSFVTVMVIVRNMLKLDYAMQVTRAHVSECYLLGGMFRPFG